MVYCSRAPGGCQEAIETLIHTDSTDEAIGVARYVRCFHHSCRCLGSSSSLVICPAVADMSTLWMEALVKPKTTPRAVVVCKVRVLTFGGQICRASEAPCDMMMSLTCLHSSSALTLSSSAHCGAAAPCTHGAAGYLLMVAYHYTAIQAADTDIHR